MTPRRPLWLLLPVLSLALLRAAAAAPSGADLAAALHAGTGGENSFEGSQAAGVVLANGDLSRINLHRSDLRGATLTNLNLAGANLSQSSLRGAILSHVNLTEANLADADLSGAWLRMVNLDGASLAAAQLDGVRFEQPLLTATGATHLTALRLALQQATGVELTRAQTAALSGDAFSFVYNSQDAAFWPGQPFGMSPLIAAPAALGVEARLRSDFTADKYLFEDKDAAKSVHMLAVRLAAPEQRAVLDTPVWVLLTGRQVQSKHLYFTLTAPLLGTFILRKDELVSAWQEPSDLLQPVGSQPAAKKALLTLTPQTQLRPAEQQAAAVARQAVLMITDKRTYGPLVPGEAGWLRLAADLQNAARTGDWEAAQRLAQWQGYPRQCVTGAKVLAVEYLTSAAEGLPPALAGPFAEAARQCEVQLALLASWPALTPADAAPAGWQARLHLAAELATGMAVAERKLAETLTPVAQ